MRFIFDANVLIALLTREHIHHRRVTAWASSVDHFPLCSIVEGAWIRCAIRIGIGAREAQHVLSLVHHRRGYEFIANAPSYLYVKLDHVHGHRQVTDTYLAALARGHNGLLATLDEGLAANHPDVARLVPETAL